MAKKIFMCEVLWNKNILPSARLKNKETQPLFFPAEP